MPFLGQAALDAVRQWRFTPPQLNGEPIAVIMTVTVNFTAGLTPMAPTASKHTDGTPEAAAPPTPTST